MTDNQTILTVAQFAALHNVHPRTVRQKAQADGIPGAKKFGRDWAIPSDAPYIDQRIKTGEYVGWRQTGRKVPELQKGCDTPELQKGCGLQNPSELPKGAKTTEG